MYLSGFGYSVSIDNRLYGANQWGMQLCCWSIHRRMLERMKFCRIHLLVVDT